MRLNTLKFFLFNYFHSYYINRENLSICGNVTDPPGFEPGTTGSAGQHSVLAELRVLDIFHIRVKEAIPKVLSPFLNTVSTPLTINSLVILFDSSGS